MQIVIDIPEEIKAVIDKNGTNEMVTETVWQAIKKGTPLPKGHGDLIAEKERLIKKDIVSIENRVRHAFNQGYEMGLKENKSEIPNTCGDAISRQAVLEGLASIAKAKAKSDAQKSLMGRVMFFTEQLPSIAPQQRTGRWVKEGQGGRYKWMCSNCGTHHRALYDYCPSCGCKMEVEE